MSTAMKKISIVCLFGLVSSMVSGCVGMNSSSQTTTTDTPPVLIPIAQSSFTAQPAKITIQPTPTLTLSPVPQVATNPPGNSTEDNQWIEDFLKNHDNCRLPCFAGIEPNVSNIDKAEKFFRDKGWYWDNAYRIPVTSLDLDSNFSIAIGFLVNDGTIEAMNIGMSGDDYLDRIGVYSLSNLLKEYGQPSQIRINLDIHGEIDMPKQAGYSLLVFYDKRGILASYSGIALKKANKYQLCPNTPRSGVSGENSRGGGMAFFVQSATNSNPLDTIMTRFQHELVLGNSLEEVSDLNSKQFLQQAIDSKLAPFCFTILPDRPSK